MLVPVFGLFLTVSTILKLLSQLYTTDVRYMLVIGATFFLPVIITLNTFSELTFFTGIISPIWPFSKAIAEVVIVIV